MNGELEILLDNIKACRQRLEKMMYSLEKNKLLFPLEIKTLKNMTDEQEESIDALILRYSQCVSMIQDQIFRGIAYLEQEDLSNKSSRDRTLLMEKLGAIRSAEEFGTAAILRNKFSHHYPQETIQQVEKLNFIVTEAEFVIEIFHDIVAYLVRKGFAEPDKTL
ncbi:MAG: hypothetical protein OEV66_04430 [Spirochaetia bacterium]|nr:hypothetical protein [Spirochaetia bacterium]